MALGNLTATVADMVANQAELEESYCPSNCDLDPSTSIGFETIGGIIFVAAVGVCVGTDCTLESFRTVVAHSKRAFVCGIMSQFVTMPLYAFVLTLIFKDDMTNDAYYSYEAAVLGMMIVGCLPGGNTSNLFTWFCKGNVSLSILMSLFSNVVALGMMPLLLYIYYDLRFDDMPAKPEVPYRDLVVPLVVTIFFVGVGMFVKAKAGAETIWWTSKISSLFGLFFLALSVILGLRKYPHMLGSSYGVWIPGLTMQPAGYMFGWLFATISKGSLRDKITISFETGVQSFTLGLVMAQLGFNAEKEACQFASVCMELLDPAHCKLGAAECLDRYLYTWAGDGRISVGDGLNEVTVPGFLPGGAGQAATGGCCRYNELIYLDVFKMSAMCSLLYAIHALWLVFLLRKIFPGGYPVNKEIRELESESWPDGSYKRERTTKADEPLEVSYAPTGFGSELTPARTMPELLDMAAARCNEELALAYEWPVPPCPPGKPQEKIDGTHSRPLCEWTRWTWKEYVDDVRTAARAFIHLGMPEYGSVVVFGFNSPQWNIASLAAMYAGGKTAGIYPTDTIEQAVYKSRHSGATVAIVEDATKLARFKGRMGELPNLRAFVLYAAAPSPVDVSGFDVPVLSWNEMMDMGRDKVEPELQQRRNDIRPGQCAVLVYTSGTTGMPKAVMLSHDNLAFQGQALRQVLKNQVGVEYDAERVLSFLPLSHIAGFMIDVVFPVSVTALTNGYVTVYFSRPYDLKEGTLKNRLTFARPTIFVGVPRVWEKFGEGLQAVARSIAALEGIKARMPIFCCWRKSTVSSWAKRQGLETSRNWQLGRSGRTSTWFGLAEALVLSRVKAMVGLDACKMAAVGAAPIRLETLEYFGSLDIRLNELYGMSESTGVTTLSHPDRYVWGSCGFAQPGVEVKVFHVDPDTGAKKECPRAQDFLQPTGAEQGEICFRGRHIMLGYFANPDMGEEHVAELEQKTREAIDDDGWLHSGDMGCMDTNGMIRITGRYKELIIGAGGENIAPAPIEDEIKKRCTAISNVMMVGDKRKFNTCLVTLKAKGATGEQPGGDELDGPAASLVAGVTTVSGAKASAEYRAAIEKAIQGTNENSVVCPSQASRIQKFAILDHDFSCQGGELTPTLKLKRMVTCDIHKTVIDKMYGE